MSCQICNGTRKVLVDFFGVSVEADCECVHSPKPAPAGMEDCPECQNSGRVLLDFDGVKVENFCECPIGRALVAGMKSRRRRR